MRTVFLVDRAYPPSPEDLAAGAAAGAAEVICGIPADLAALGIVTFGYHEVPAPAAPRRLVAKSLVIRRLQEAGLLTDAIAMLDLPENLYARERWRTPDWPNVYFDDPDTVALLTACGADPAAILAP